METLSHRQNLILNFIKHRQEASTKEIKKYIDANYQETNRITIIRDLEVLLNKNLIAKQGQGRATYYTPVSHHQLLYFFDPQDYFETPPDERRIQETFNFSVVNSFSQDNIFSHSELTELDKLNEKYRERMNQLTESQLKKEFERLTIELSWKSSQIEGNTYSLIDTEILLKENKQAEGHTQEEAHMILNHKHALDYIRQQPDKFRKLSLKNIEELHKIIVHNMGVKTNLRNRLVGITGTKFKPLDNKYQIEEAMTDMINIVNNPDNHPLFKALSAILLTSYIQPFEDGNKRTARLLGNAILLAHNYCPLSYRSIDEGDYKKATLLFYEQNSALFFKELFINQFKFSLDNYFLL